VQLRKTNQPRKSATKPGKNSGHGSPPEPQKRKSLLLLFFRKEDLFLLDQALPTVCSTDITARARES
jgi:hypothetical protein